MSEQIFREIKPRFYRKVRVVYQDENKTCAYAIHNGRWSVFDTKTSRRTSRGLRVMRKLTFELRSPIHQQNAIQAIQQILPDPTKPIVVSIQERNRSLDQNRKLWACLGDVSRQVEWHGRWLDAESWKCVFTAALKQQDVVPNLAGNGFVVIGQSTSRMRVSEFAELLELIQAFGTERGVKWSDEARLALEWKARWGDRAA